MKVLLILIKLLALSFIIVSCSTQQNVTNIDHDGVTLKNESNLESKDQLKIDEASFQGETPKEETQEPIFEYKSEQKGLNLFLGPGCYQTFALTGFLKSIERNRLKITSITGLETGLLVAALYSKYKKSSIVEWHLFKFLQSTSQSQKVGSFHWKMNLQKFVKEHFAKMKVEELPLLKVPVCNKTICELTENGDLENLLWKHLEHFEVSMLSSDDFENYYIVNHLKNKNVKIDEWYDYQTLNKQLIKAKSFLGAKYWEVEFKKTTDICHDREWQKSLADAQASGNLFIKHLKKQELQ